jgi:hypothetical protein
MIVSMDVDLPPVVDLVHRLLGAVLSGGQCPPALLLERRQRRGTQLPTLRRLLLERSRHRRRPAAHSQPASQPGRYIHLAARRFHRRMQPPAPLPHPPRTQRARGCAHRGAAAAREGVCLSQGLASTSRAVGPARACIAHTLSIVMIRTGGAEPADLSQISVNMDRSQDGNPPRLTRAGRRSQRPQHQPPRRRAHHHRTARLRGAGARGSAQAAGGRHHPLPPLQRSGGRRRPAAAPPPTCSTRSLSKHRPLGARHSRRPAPLREAACADGQD